MIGDDFVRLRAGRRGLAAGLEALPQEAGGEAVRVRRLGTRGIDAFGTMSPSKAGHALHGGEGLPGKSREAGQRSARADACLPMLRARRSRMSP